MPRMPRLVVPGLPHHVTQRGNRRQKVFFKDSDRIGYLGFLSEAALDFGVRCAAWCLMPNHVHIIAVPEKEDSLALCFGRAHTRYTTHINRREGWSGFLWQGRFHSCVMDDAHTFRAVRYVERNPVRAGIVRVPWAYRWSSARFHCGEVEHDPLISGRPLVIVPDWKDYLRVEEEADWAKEWQHKTSVGRPAGSESFVSSLEALSGRVLHPRKKGRPKKMT